MPWAFSFSQANCHFTCNSFSHIKCPRQWSNMLIKENPERNRGLVLQTVTIHVIGYHLYNYVLSKSQIKLNSLGNRLSKINKLLLGTKFQVLFWENTNTVKYCFYGFLQWWAREGMVSNTTFWNDVILPFPFAVKCEWTYPVLCLMLVRDSVNLPWVFLYK